jgi:hypothetical protein
MSFMMRNFEAVKLTETFTSLPPELAREVRDRVAGAPAPKKVPVSKGQQQQQRKKRTQPHDIDFAADAPVVARPGPVLIPDDLHVLSLATDQQRPARPTGGKRSSGNCILS